MRGYNLMVTIVSKSGMIYTLQDSNGETRQMSRDFLKEAMRRGLIVSNAHLSTKGRLIMNRNGEIKDNAIRDYRRTEELVSASFEEKCNYYWINLVGRCFDLSIYTIDELDAIFCGSLRLELDDNGSSRVDERLSKNLYTFPTIGSVFKEIINRGYLKEEDIRKYVLGVDEHGRYINRYSLAEWVLMHRK